MNSDDVSWIKVLQDIIQWMVFKVAVFVMIIDLKLVCLAWLNKY
jgi:hypothetical protein